MPSFNISNLPKAILKMAKTTSVENVNATANRIQARQKWLLKALNASAATRNAIRTRAVASSDPGQKQLAGTLAIYETLSPADKVKFIMGIKRSAKAAISALPLLANPRAWSWIKPPPRGGGRGNVN